MAEVYDNWERLVAATLKREEFRELARAPSMETSFSSSISGRFNAPFNFKFKSAVNHESGESYFLKTILLADQLARVSKNTTSFRQECLEIKYKAEKVALLLRGAEHANQKIYDRPARYVTSIVENVLKNAISLVLKCRGLKRLFVIVSSASFTDISLQLEHSIGNICWLFRDDQYRGIPTIAADKPILFDIWELIAILHTGSVEDRCNAMASIVSLVCESDDNRKLIVEEGCGIKPFLRLVEDGTPEAQEKAMMVLASLVSFAHERDVYRKLIIEEGCKIQPLLRLVEKGKSQVQENAVAIIASLLSLARESNTYKKLIFEEGCAIKPLLRLVEDGIPEAQENAVMVLASLISLARERDVYRKLIIKKRCVIETLLRLVEKGDLQAQENAVAIIASLLSWARESNTYKKLKMETGEIKALLRLVQEGTLEVQENAITIIALTGKENWGFIGLKVGSVFLRILQEDPPKKLQRTMAWALSELAEILYHFEVVDVLIDLTFKTLPEDIKVNLTCRLDGVGRETRKNNLDDESNISPFIATEMKDDETDDYIQAMATRVLWQLAKERWTLITSQTNAKLALCFAFFLHRGPKEARYNSVMALMEITAYAEGDTTLFKLLPVDNLVVDQLLRIIDKKELEILIPCIKVIGNLARTFRAPEKKMIDLLVRMLDGREIEVSRQASVALIKFVYFDIAHVNHSKAIKAIIDAGWLKLLIQYAYPESEIVDPSTLKRLGYIVLNAPWIKGEIDVDMEKLSFSDLEVHPRCLLRLWSILPTHLQNYFT